MAWCKKTHQAIRASRTPAAKLSPTLAAAGKVQIWQISSIQFASDMADSIDSLKGVPHACGQAKSDSRGGGESSDMADFIDSVCFRYGRLNRFT